ncbi:MAG: ion transporter [Stenotrophomonas maltophilia]
MDPGVAGLKKRVYEVLEVTTPGDRTSQIFDVFLMALICLNAFALIMGTVRSIYQTAPIFFNSLERASVAVFTVEYLLRIWACTSAPKYAHPIFGRIRFAFSPLMLIDLLAILPFYVVPLLDVKKLDLRFLRAVRLFARVARLARYSTGVRTLGAVLDSRKYDLLTAVAVLSLLLVVASSLMFFAESEAQPDKFPSIPAAMWWSIITLTTVGYGDVIPVTLVGRLLAALIAILRIGMFALPAGLLASGFQDESQQRRRQESRLCPHCGEELPG